MRWMQAALVGLAGCAWWMGREEPEQTGLRLQAALAKRGLAVEVNHCRRVSTSVAVTCTARMDAADFAPKRSAWALRPAGLEDVQLGGRCTGLAARPEAHIYAPSSVDPLRGTSLTGLVIVWDGASGEACVGARPR